MFHKSSPAKYYQKNKVRLQKSLEKNIEVFLKKKNKKSKTWTLTT